MGKLVYVKCINYDCGERRVRVSEDPDVGHCEICLTRVDLSAYRRR